MTEQDRPKLAEALAVLSETFGVPLSAVKVRAYFEALRDLPIAEVLTGCQVCLRTLRYFPKPVEVREAVVGSAEDQADLAWAQVLNEVGRVGWCGQPKLAPAVAESVRLLFGSWRQACETIPSDGPEAVGWAKQFKSLHEARVRRASTGELPAPTRISELAPGVQALIRERFPRLVTEKAEGDSQ